MFLLFLFSCAKTPTPTAVTTIPQCSLPPSWQAARCVPLIWGDHPQLGERASVAVPIHIQGHEYLFQLDTGSDASFLYGRAAADSLAVPWRTEENFEVGSVHISLAGQSRDVDLLLHPDMEPDESIQGTLGMDLLVGQTLLLDFVNSQLCFGGKSNNEGFTQVPAELRRNRLFVHTTVGEVNVPNLIYDTGSSPIDLLVDETTWQVLTGTSAEQAQVITAGNWGTEATFLTSSARGPLKIGDILFPTPSVYYRKDRPTQFADWGFDVIGLLGNHPFFDGRVILDLGTNPSFSYQHCR